MYSRFFFIVATIVIISRFVICNSQVTNERPIIGLFAQPSTDSISNCGGNCQYIAASYVKFLESAGARVVPIDYYANSTVLDGHLSSLNGIVFPGGSSSFPTAAQYVFDKVVALNKKDDYFPLLGICMGFQWLLVAATNDINILDPPSGQMDSYNYSIPVSFTNTARHSRTFSGASSDIMKTLSTENVTMNNHHYGIWTEHFQTTPVLTSFFNVLSNSYDRQNREFVSDIEAFDYPIYGHQWHPEKNPFEWQLSSDGTPYEAINHSAEGILATQYVGNFFVSESRKSAHKFPTSAEEQAALIYNYPAIKTTGDFVEKYYFHF